MKKVFGFGFLLLGVVLFSCQNNDKQGGQLTSEELSEKSTQIAMDEIAMESATTELDYEVDFYANAEFVLSQWMGMGKRWGWMNGLRYKYNHCPDLTIENEDGGYPKTITLDYGDSTVLRSGKVLSGVVIIEISGPRSDGDYTRFITYEDFGVDSLVVNGTAQVTVDRENSVFRTFTSDLVFLLADGTSINRTSVREWEWIEGIDSEMDQTDDMVQITGYTNATTSEGDEYMKEIIEPLIRTRNCRFIVQGVVEITLNGELLSSLDYGDGECNDVAILTQDGETAEVDLSVRKCRFK
ncbi:hypothetical protein [Maribellus maritimus]|uniref:hypothetical protein n=1 Tax=Maribellus maritimus TaxID=2870838 RepID=UPI001EEA7377|nr:hypothetical protein [Maribellus maritimus]MCG6188869.1 hypothetical protein [Maribellus maritimus]